MDIIEAWQNIDTSLKEAVANYLLVLADQHQTRKNMLGVSRVSLPDQIERTRLLIDALYTAAQVIVGQTSPEFAPYWETVTQGRKEDVYFHLLRLQADLATIAEGMEKVALPLGAKRHNDYSDACYFAAILLGYQDPRKKSLLETAKDAVASAVTMMTMTAVWKDGEMLTEWSEGKAPPPGATPQPKAHARKGRKGKA